MRIVSENLLLAHLWEASLTFYTWLKLIDRVGFEMAASHVAELFDAAADDDVMHVNHYQLVAV